MSTPNSVAQLRNVALPQMRSPITIYVRRPDASAGDADLPIVQGDGDAHSDAYHSPSTLPVDVARMWVTRKGRNAPALKVKVRSALSPDSRMTMSPSAKARIDLVVSVKVWAVPTATSSLLANGESSPAGVLVNLWDTI